MKAFEPRTTRTCIYTRAGRVIHRRTLGGVDTLAEDARENVQVLSELGNGVPVALLADLTAPNVRPASPEARAIYTAPSMREVISRCALLVRSPVSRVIGSLFLLFSRPPYPTKLFTSEAEALAWLTETDEATVAS